MKGKRKYELNVNRFDKIDSQETAYWLGFLIGDGSVEKYSLRIELSNKDIGHIEKLRDFMQSTHPIKSVAKECSRICFNSIVLVNKLREYGIIENKTYTQISTPNITQVLLPHFYRGLFDADGWLTEHKHKNCKSGFEIGFSSYFQNILIEIQDWFNQQLGHKVGYIKTRKRKNQLVSQLIIGGNYNFIKSTRLLYQDCNIYLNRKYFDYLEKINELHSRNIRYKYI